MTTDGLIPVGHILKIVRKHTADNGWCEEVEDCLTDYLELHFQKARTDRHGDIIDTSRFKPVPDSPEHITREQLTTALDKAIREYGHRGSVNDLVQEIRSTLHIDPPAPPRPEPGYYSQPAVTYTANPNINIYDVYRTIRQREQERARRAQARHDPDPDPPRMWRFSPPRP
jgi:hypothetical protein